MGLALCSRHRPPGWFCGYAAGRMWIPRGGDDRGGDADQLSPARSDRQVGGVPGEAGGGGQDTTRRRRRWFCPWLGVVAV